MALLGKAVNWISLAAAILMVICGAIHVGRSIEDWCTRKLIIFPRDADPRKLTTTGIVFSTVPREDRACVGPWLFWEVDGKGWDATDRINAGWSFEVFNLIPTLFFDQWTAVFLGLLSADIHFGDDHWELVSDNWARKAIWHIFIAAFGAFGYAGKLGIITGFICVAVSALSILVMFLDPEERPSLGLRRGDELHAHERRKSDAGLTVYQPQMSKANIADEGLNDTGDDTAETASAPAEEKQEAAAEEEEKQEAAEPEQQEAEPEAEPEPEQEEEKAEEAEAADGNTAGEAEEDNADTGAVQVEVAEEEEDGED